MKKTITCLCLVLFLRIQVSGQILKPITWSYAAKKMSATEATVYIKATIDKSWHLYSQYVKDGGPVKTTFTFPSSNTYNPVGKTIEPKPITKFEATFKMDVSYFEKSVIFQQEVKLKDKSPIITGTVEFMVCDDKQCLPPEEIKFSVPVK